MDIKYYDLISTAIIGVVIVTAVNYLFLGIIEIDSLAYLALGYLTGYFINAIGSLMAFVYYKTIGGRPSDKLLTPVPGQDWTGYKKVPLFFSANTVERLRYFPWLSVDIYAISGFICLIMVELRLCLLP